MGTPSHILLAPDGEFFQTENETEVSFFNGASYEAFKVSPEV
jgi:hypothetical protein